ncbi:MAG: flippase-like domain-containing protein [Bacteriovoracaceae bacterium]|nr:flippase-like domain-containing protein [Bacteriovoracaceae bacterium]
MKKYLIPFLKLLFVFAILTWFYYSGRMDFGFFKISLKYKWEWFLCLSLLVLSDVIASLRWKVILTKSTEQKLSMLHALQLTWIGLFFNTVLPGIISGDLIKVYYTAKRNYVRRTHTFSTIIYDRLIGLFGLLILYSFGIIFWKKELLMYGDQAKYLIHSGEAIGVALPLFFIFLFMSKRHLAEVISLTKRIPFLGTHTNNFLQILLDITTNKIITLASIFLSILAQLCAILAFWFIMNPAVGGRFPLEVAFCVVPLGVLTTAIPITPAGLGIGHLAFDVLMQLFNFSSGASLFNIFIAGIMFVNLLGIFPYILYSDKKLKDVLAES